MNKKNSYLEYLRTVLITMLVLIVVSIFMLISARFHVKDSVSEEELALQNDMIGYLIGKYKHLQTANPQNASIDLKLGQLYEMLASYSQAEKEYLSAIKKRNGYFEAASFKLAGVYLMKGEFANADKVLQGIPDSSRYSIILEKGLFYKSYGDALFNKSQFDIAIEKYQRALFYLEKIKSSYVNEVKASLCETNIAMADSYVSQQKTLDALNVLQDSLEACKTPVLLYKLGLLNLEKNPEYSVQLFEKVLKEDPTIINFTIYKKLLFSLKMQYDFSGEKTKSKLYDAKLTRLRSYIQRHVLQDSELLFQNFNFKVKRYAFKNEYDFGYIFDVTNTTTNDIPKLYAIIYLIDEKGNIIYEHQENIVKKGGSLNAAANALSTEIVLKFRKSNLTKYEKIESKLYLSKNPKISKLLYVNNKVDVTKGKKTK